MRQDRRGDKRGADEPNEARTAKSWEQVERTGGDSAPNRGVCRTVRRRDTESERQSSGERIFFTSSHRRWCLRDSEARAHRRGKSSCGLET